MSKRVNNAKGIPSKNKANNRYLRGLREERRGLDKSLRREAKEGEEDVHDQIKARLGRIRIGLKRLTPKRFLRRHQGR